MPDEEYFYIIICQNCFNRKKVTAEEYKRLSCYYCKNCGNWDCSYEVQKYKKK